MVGVANRTDFDGKTGGHEQSPPTEGLILQCAAPAAQLPFGQTDKKAGRRAGKLARSPHRSRVNQRSASACSSPAPSRANSLPSAASRVMAPPLITPQAARDRKSCVHGK